MSNTSSEQQAPDLANAQVTGGGGHEPDLAQSDPDDVPVRQPAATGSGVDLKSKDLPEGEDT